MNFNCKSDKLYVAGGDIIYKNKNNIDKILRGDYTFFVETKDLKKIKSVINEKKYNIYYLYDESNKVIIYKDKLPNIIVYEIVTKTELRHQDILGALYSLNISGEMFGDVIIDEGRYYICIIDLIDNYLKSNFQFIGKNKIELLRKDISIINNYKQKYEELTVIVSSLRVDNIVSKIVNCNRNKAVEIINNKDLNVNYEIITKCSYILKENDIFSIRKYGKYKYIGIENNTKRNNLIIKCLKYI